MPISRASQREERGMAPGSSPVVAAPEFRLERNENCISCALPWICIADYRMWMNSAKTEHLEMSLFTQKGVDAPRQPMISHIYPWASTIVLGGTRWCCYRARPLPDACGGALGEASGAVSFHLREQGRPQGASFSAGDLSLHPRDPSSTQ